MLRRPPSRRGLAEIVGTLMLVLIVVAAAVAFAFFVASYQSTLTREETANHDKALEDIHVIGLVPRVASDLNLSSLQMRLVSGDVNTISISSMNLNGYTVTNYNTTQGGLTGHGCLQGNPFVAPSGCYLTLPAESQITLVLDVNRSDYLDSASYAFANGGSSPLDYPVFTQKSVFDVEVFTSLGNEFTFTFVPPVAIPTVYYVQDGSSSIPVLDGLSSNQPAESDNASLLYYNWTLVSAGGPSHDIVDYYGAEVSVPTLPPVTNNSSCTSSSPVVCEYVGTLTVVSTNGLSDSTTFDLSQVASSVTFNETTLPSGTNWIVDVSGGLNYSNSSGPHGGNISLVEPSGGFYAYTVPPAAGKLALPPSGTFVANGGIVKLTFS